jgi:SH3 domain protein
MPFRLIAWTCLLLGAVAAHAQTRYVSDKLSIELRRGPSNEYLIIKNLEAGEAVEVLEQSNDGYSRVRVPASGSEGWVLTRLLSNESSARDRLAVAERSLGNSRNRVTELEQQVAALTSELGTTKSELDTARANHGQASQELASIRTAAANVVEIRDQNESLRQKLIDRERQVEQLTAENAVLSGRTAQNWFIVGAGVLLGGIVIGLVAPSLRRKRRSDW